MGWASGSEVLEAMWPVIEARVPYVDDRSLLYVALIEALEEQDADTLGEVVYCTTDTVDPILVDILKAMGHLDDEQEED